MSRWIRVAAVALAGLTACGSNQDPTLEAVPSSVPADPGTTVPGDPAGGDSTVVAGDTTAPPGTADDAGGTPTTATPGGGAAPGDGGGAPQFGPPAAGRYTFHTTGTQALNGSPQAVDEQGVMTVEHLNATDVRQGSADGSQTTVLRYLPDQVQLVSLQLNIPGAAKHFVADPPVLFAPVPPTAGQSWEWQLTSTDGRTTVAQASSVSRTETVTIMGAPVETTVIDSTITISGDINGTVQLSSWLDVGRRTAVRLHQVSNLVAGGGLFRVNGDTTSVLVGFTPA